MTAQRLSNGAQFQWRGLPYQINQLLPEGQVVIEDLLSGGVSNVEMLTLVRALFDDELHFLTGPQIAPKGATGAAPASNSLLALSDYPVEGVAIARYRLDIIHPLLELQPRTRADVVARVETIKADQVANGERSLRSVVSVAAVYRWLKDYTQSGQDLRALIPEVHERGGKGRQRLPNEVNALLEKVLQDKSHIQEKITIDDLRQELAVRLAEENQLRPATAQLQLPSRDTIAQHWARQERPTRTAGRSAALKQYGQTPYPEVPLERVEIDHTRSDLIVIDDRDNLPLGRLTLTYCLDLATRYPLGYYLGFEPPSYLTVMECLHHAILPKGDIRACYGTQHDWLAYGIPATLVIDNGKEFIGHDLEEACCLLGTILQYSPVLTPQFKAGVERMFGSMNTLLFHTLPGTTFSNPTERGSYDSARQACVYLSEVDKLMHLFVVDIYAERFHRGLQAIPARCWEDKIRRGFAPALPPGAQALSIWLSRRDTRVLHPYGIEFASLRYNCDELITLRTRLKGQPAKIKYHPADLSSLHVYDPFERSYVRVPALDQDYTTGLSLWKHRVIRQAVLEEQDHVDLVALGQAKRKIQAIVDEGRQRQRQHTRTRIARWDTAGKPTRQVAELPLPLECEDTAVSNDSSRSAAMSHLSLLDVPDEAGWEVSYLPLKTATVPLNDQAPEVSHG